MSVTLVARTVGEAMSEVLCHRDEQVATKKAPYLLSSTEPSNSPVAFASVMTSSSAEKARIKIIEGRALVRRQVIYPNKINVYSLTRHK